MSLDWDFSPTHGSRRRIPCLACARKPTEIHVIVSPFHASGYRPESESDGALLVLERCEVPAKKQRQVKLGTSLQRAVVGLLRACGKLLKAHRATEECLEKRSSSGSYRGDINNEEEEDEFAWRDRRNDDATPASGEYYSVRLWHLTLTRRGGHPDDTFFAVMRLRARLSVLFNRDGWGHLLRRDDVRRPDWLQGVLRDEKEAQQEAANGRGGACGGADECIVDAAFDGLLETCHECGFETEFAFGTMASPFLATCAPICAFSTVASLEDAPAMRRDYFLRSKEARAQRAAEEREKGEIGLLPRADLRQKRSWALRFASANATSGTPNVKDRASATTAATANDASALYRMRSQRLSQTALYCWHNEQQKQQLLQSRSYIPEKKTTPRRYRQRKLGTELPIGSKLNADSAAVNSHRLSSLYRALPSTNRLISSLPQPRQKKDDQHIIRRARARRFLALQSSASSLSQGSIDRHGGEEEHLEEHRTGARIGQDREDLSELEKEMLALLRQHSSGTDERFSTKTKKETAGKINDEEERDGDQQMAGGALDRSQDRDHDRNNVLEGRRRAFLGAL